MLSPATTTRFDAAVGFLIAQNYGSTPAHETHRRLYEATKVYWFMTALVANATGPDKTVPAATGRGSSMPVTSSNNEEDIGDDPEFETISEDWRDLCYPHLGPQHLAGQLSLLWPANPESKTFPIWYGSLYSMYREIMEQIWLGDWETAAPPNHSPDPLRTPTDHTYLE